MDFLCDLKYHLSNTYIINAQVWNIWVISVHKKKKKHGEKEKEKKKQSKKRRELRQNLSKRVELSQLVKI